LEAESIDIAMQNLTIKKNNSQNWRNIHGFRWKRLYIRGKRVFSTYTQHTPTFTIAPITYTQDTLLSRLLEHRNYGTFS